MYINLDIDVHGFIFNVNYIPGYDPYPTSNPDHPAFSDPGEPEDVELVSMRTPFGKIDQGRFASIMFDKYRDQILELCRDYDDDWPSDPDDYHDDPDREPLEWL